MALLTHKMPNGLQIVADHNPRCQLTSIGYFVRAGSRDETMAVSGVSHFLEHMCFKGTPTRSALEINQQLDDMGANSNARTSEESTIYHATVLPEFQSSMVELLTDMMRPSLQEEDFETEKQVILEEIAMYKDQPPYGGHEQVMANYFGQHALAKSVLGTEQTVSALTSDSMRQYHRNHYAASNLILVLAGRVDMPQVIADIERCTAQWEKLPMPQRDCQAHAGNPGREFLHAPSSNQQYILQLSPGPAHDDPLRFAARLGASVFGDDSGSRLFWELIDPGLADLASVGHFEYEATGTLMSLLSVRPEDTAEIWAKFEAMEREFDEAGPSENELELAKAKAIASMNLSHEISENRMFDLGSQWLSFGNYRSVEEITQWIEAVTITDVHQVWQRFPTSQKQVLFIGPDPTIALPFLKK